MAQIFILVNNKSISQSNNNNLRLFLFTTFDEARFERRIVEHFMQTGAIKTPHRLGGAPIDRPSAPRYKTNVNTSPEGIS